MAVAARMGISHSSPVTFQYSSSYSSQNLSAFGTR